MDRTKIDEMLHIEKEIFKNAISDVLSTAIERRSGMLDKFVKAFGLDTYAEISEQKFFEVLDVCNTISGNLSAVFLLAGFDQEISSSWFEKKNAPKLSMRHQTLSLLLEGVSEYYVENRTYFDLQAIVGEVGDLTMGGTTQVVVVSRAELFSSAIDSFDEFQNLSTRTRKCIQNEQISTLGELLLKTESELLMIPNFGRKSFNEVGQLLQMLGLGLGNLSSDEISGIKNRLLLNMSCEKLIAAQWPGELKHEYRNNTPEQVRKAGSSAYEIVTADNDLISELHNRGILFRTQLATAPQELLMEICSGHADWYDQLAFILNGKEHNHEKYRSKCGYLVLGMIAPQFLDKKVKVYKTT